MHHYRVVVRGYMGVADPQAWSLHKTMRGAARKVLREGRPGSSAAAYGARWSIEVVDAHGSWREIVANRAEAEHLAGREKHR